MFTAATLPKSIFGFDVCCLFDINEGGIVNNTLRPQVPERCESEWRKLMEQCWSFDPGVRPSFTEIVDRLRSMTVALQPKRRT